MTKTLLIEKLEGLGFENIQDSRYATLSKGDIDVVISTACIYLYDKSIGDGTIQSGFISLLYEYVFNYIKQKDRTGKIKSILNANQ